MSLAEEEEPDSGPPRDVFLLYNQREEGVERVAEKLRAEGIATYYYRRDVPLGGDFVNIETAKLRDALLVLILLGPLGWGPSQRTLAQRAIAINKRIIPVVLDLAPEEALNDLDGLFRRLRWVNLKHDEGAFDQLVVTIRAAIEEDEANLVRRAAPRFDDIINILVDGSDADREALLDRIIREDFADQDGLAARIRYSIQQEFAPTLETRFATAIRDPKRFAATRSWMLSVLIWLEPFSDESTAVILNHLDPRYEPERTVRFWALAGVVQRQLPYLSDAVARASKDSAPEVTNLAEIVVEPESAALHERFREALRSTSFETAWHVLRVLRVFPVPALAPDVIDQLDRSADNKPLTYDALFALASPDMAHAAAPILLENPGLPRLAALVIREARSSTSVARTAFARVLSLFDPNQMREALSAAAGDEDVLLVERLLVDIAKAQQRDASPAPLIAGYASDTIDVAKDDIGIGRDVETLVSVMLARKVIPPLAIGLFGEWGSGKSFFMRSIAAQAERIAARAKAEGDDQFCSDIVQIHFNAWHYVDTSLWANLMAHLLDGLSSHLSPEADAAAPQGGLNRELASAREERAAAEADQKRAAEQLNVSSRALQESIIERERREIRLSDLRAADLFALLKDEPRLKAEVKGALNQVGAPAAFESIAELNRVVKESYSIGGRALAFVRSILRGPNILLTIGGIVVFFAAPPFVAWLLKTCAPHVAELSSLVTQVTVAVSSIALVLRQALGHANAGLDALSEVKRKVDAQLAEKRAAPSEVEKRLENELAEAKASEKAAAERVSIATARAKVLEERVAAIERSQSLGYFVAERSHSDDYRRHLGLIAVVRKDFDGLVRRLKTGQTQGARRVDRIILYIDDVDRCPPNIVLDILQAVHLLLAYELFVVVVSVDPRWLLRSLEAKFSHLKPNELAAVTGGGATPQDYLEKIFQIPFSVRPMDNLAFGRMMKRLLAPSIAESTVHAVDPAVVPVVDSPVNPDNNADIRPKETPVELPGPALEPGAGQQGAADAPRGLKVLARAIAISTSEAAFAERLSTLLGTPRSAKRFANVYRLIKASVSSHELSKFEGTVAVPGDFQLPMLLLAALIGDSASAAALFPQFVSNAAEGNVRWWTRSVGAPEENGDSERLRQKIGAIAEGAMFPGQPGLVYEWLPRVARFSFLTARMFLDVR